MRINGSKISAAETSSAVLPSFHSSSGECDDSSISGPCLDIGLPDGAFSESAEEKIIRLFVPPIIGACILLPGDKDQVDAALPPLPQISFRAAALANMSWRPLRVNANAAAAENQ